VGGINKIIITRELKDVGIKDGSESLHHIPSLIPPCNPPCM